MVLRKAPASSSSRKPGKDPAPSVNIVPFDAKAAYVCGRLRARLEKGGTPMALADLEIAAIAIANKLTLVTGNLRHFSMIHDLPVENWLV
jgi:predicted nucleic acid-binding protein